MSLKAYFDGSEAKGHSLTLAAVAGDESVWAALEADWVALLKQAGASHMHMTDAMARWGDFRDWGEDKRDWLVDGLFALFEIHREGGRLNAFTTAVDLVAHADISQRHWLPSPARMCARGLFAKVFNWYGEFPDLILDTVELYFDRDEKFLEHLGADWKSDEFRRRHPVWDLIRTIAPVDMKKTPGVQVADMFAWSRNRVERQTNDRWHSRALGLINQSGDHFSFDRKKLETYEPYTIM